MRLVILGAVVGDVQHAHVRVAEVLREPRAIDQRGHGVVTLSSHDRTLPGRGLPPDAHSRPPGAGLIFPLTRTLSLSGRGDKC